MFDRLWRKAQDNTRPSEPGLFFGGMQLPAHATEGNFFVVGMPRSGKSIVLQLLMQQVLPRMSRPGCDERAIVYDPKRDLIPKFAGMGIPVYDGKNAPPPSGKPTPPKLFVLNPEDSRGFAWDLAKDFTRPDDADGIASVLVPPEPGNQNPYFREIARELVQGTIECLIEARPGIWTLRDLVHLFDNSGHLRTFLARSLYTHHLVDKYLSENYLSNNAGSGVLSNARRSIDQLRRIAATWHAAAEAGRKFTLREWKNAGGGILLLGKSDKNQENVERVNRLLLERATVTLLEDKRQRYLESESETRTTWVFLDELPQLGKTEALRRLLDRGGSYGIRVVYAFQDIDQLKSVMGEMEANAITAMAANFACLKVESSNTAGWAARRFRDWEQPEGGRGREQAPQRRRRVDEMDIGSITLPVHIHGLQGYYQSAHLPRIEHHQIPWPELDPNRGGALAATDRNVSSFDEWPPEATRLAPWKPWEITTILSAVNAPEVNELSKV